jgi:hypothetical protein
MVVSTSKRVLPALAAAVALAAAAALPYPALAQADAQPQTMPERTEHHRGDGMRHHRGHHGMRAEDFQSGRHIEGRIAFLKAELKITDAQQPQWDKVAAAMRDNARELDQAAGEMRAKRDQPQNAMQRLEARARFAGLRARTTQRLADAFQPLYASLSDQQKQAADELLAHHGFGRHR